MLKHRTTTPELFHSTIDCYILFFILSIAFIAPSATAQAPFFVSRNFQKALTQQSRTETGLPGKGYWQNQGIYDIDVTVNPSSGEVKGKAIITYTNNSPETLIQLNLKLFQNVHLPQTNRAGFANKDFLTDGLFIEEVKVNDKKVSWKNENIH